MVKGRNHVFAQHLTAPEVDGIAASVLIAGDDPAAKQTVFALASDMGFHSSAVPDTTQGGHF